jgi:hypothetical protein
MSSQGLAAGGLMTTGETPIKRVANEDVGNDRAKDHFLFVCGVPRSGTTAMAALVNRHPDIFIGVERYKNLPRREFGPDLFEPERFFDHREGDTNNLFSTDEHARNKFTQALWVGDKVPRYYACYNVLLKKFTSSKIIYVLRNIHDVAESWNKRAQNPADKWPEHNDYTRAVIEWNSSLNTTIQFQKKYESRLIIVNYDEIFSGNTTVLKNILDQLDLPLPDFLLTSFQDMTRGWADRVGRSKRGKSEQDMYLEDHADWAAFETLRQLAVPADHSLLDASRSL